MSTRWTKGPWRVSDARTGGEYWVVAGEGKGFGLIAEVCIEADARLIAAAPALAEALSEADGLLDDIEDNSSAEWRIGMRFDEIRELIRAALASAKGEQ